MEQVNLHKQKLYSLIIAGVAFIGLILPWVTISFGGFGGGSANGFRGWGILTLLGVIGVAVSCFLGNKALPFDNTFKKVALGSFAAISLGALIFYLRLDSFGGESRNVLDSDSGFGDIFGSGVKMRNPFSSGAGLWICLVTGLAGVAFLMGFVKLPDPKKPQ